MSETPKGSGNEISSEKRMQQNIDESFAESLSQMSAAEDILNNLLLLCEERITSTSKSRVQNIMRTQEDSWANPSSFDTDWVLTRSNDLRDATRKLQSLLYPVIATDRPSNIMCNARLNGRVFSQYREVSEKFVKICTVCLDSRAYSKSWVVSVIAIIQKALAALNRYEKSYISCRDSMYRGCEVISFRGKKK